MQQGVVDLTKLDPGQLKFHNEAQKVSGVPQQIVLTSNHLISTNVCLLALLLFVVIYLYPETLQLKCICNQQYIPKRKKDERRYILVNYLAY